MLNRAAQFSPFSALTGYGDAVDETIRLTDEQIELDEETKAMLNLKLQFLLENPQTEAVFTYFQKEKKKTAAIPGRNVISGNPSLRSHFETA